MKNQKLPRFLTNSLFTGMLHHSLNKTKLDYSLHVEPQPEEKEKKSKKT